MGAFDINYMPHTAIKGKVLADLVTKFTKSPTVVEAEEQGFGAKKISTVSIHRHSP